MSAEVLRRAAASMRERAEAEPNRVVTDSRVTGVWLNSAYYLTMTPAVALAVADWLDLVAVDGDNGYDESDDKYRSAMNVAHTYLGVQP